MIIFYQFKYIVMSKITGISSLLTVVLGSLYYNVKSVIK